jgi:hypothetical protein
MRLAWLGYIPGPLSWTDTVTADRPHRAVLTSTDFAGPASATASRAFISRFIRICCIWQPRQEHYTHAGGDFAKALGSVGGNDANWTEGSFTIDGCSPVSAVTLGSCKP